MITVLCGSLVVALSAP
ncbi:hypothetical protein Q5N41_18210 [Vibrio cholerae]|nr:MULTISPECIES: hypothetical protein [Vibrio]MDV2380292.1 hypothetical protein [Vibrio cholerae]